MDLETLLKDLDKVHAPDALNRLLEFSVQDIVVKFQRYPCEYFEGLTMRGKANFIADIFNDACYSPGDDSVGSFIQFDLETELRFRALARRIIARYLVIANRPDISLHNLNFKAVHGQTIPKMFMVDLRSPSARRKFNLIV